MAKRQRQFVQASNAFRALHRTPHRVCCAERLGSSSLLHGERDAEKDHTHERKQCLLCVKLRSRVGGARASLNEGLRRLAFQAHHC